MKLINLTPHTINICGDAGEAIHSVEPSGEVARVEVTFHPDDPVVLDSGIEIPVAIEGRGLDTRPRVVGIPKRKSRVNWDGEITGDAEIRTIYLVSRMVAELAARPDVMAPDTGPESVIRNEAGQIIGVKRLLAFASREIDDNDQAF